MHLNGVRFVCMALVEIGIFLSGDIRLENRMAALHPHRRLQRLNSVMIYVRPCSTGIIA